MNCEFLGFQIKKVIEFKLFSYILKAALFASVFFSSFQAFAETGEAANSSSSKSKDEAVVRNIYIKVYDIFEDDLGKSFYKTVNQLKIITKEYIIYQDMLLKEGDRYSKFLLEESERALRQLDFLRKVTIAPDFEGNSVDLYVEVQDTWTLFPQFAYSVGGGSSKKAIGIADNNLLGYGKRAELLWSEIDGRKSIEAIWDDSRFLGSKNSLLLGHFDRADGYRSIFSFSKPFRSLVDKTSWQVQSDFSDLVARQFEFSDESYIYRKKHSEAALGYTFSSASSDKTTRKSLISRYTLGYSYLDEDFTEAVEEDFRDVDLNPESVRQGEEFLADDRKFSGPFVSFSLIEADFLTADYIDSFERAQDFNMGVQFNQRLQVASSALGSKEDTLLSFSKLSKGWKVKDLNFFRAQASSEFRLHDSGFDDFSTDFEFRHYNVLGAKYLGSMFAGKHTIASSLKLSVTEDMDLDSQHLLGARTGLRGYENKTFFGNSHFILNLEDRFSFSENVYQLFNLGGAFFVDVGSTNVGDFEDVFKSRIYSDIGIGLRVGFPRSSGGSVLRVDLAFPLKDGPDGSEKFTPQLLITSGQIFGGYLKGEGQSIIKTESVLTP